MAWESKAPDKQYYYRSVRVGGRVRKRYFGRGLAGKTVAQQDALRLAARDAWQVAVRQWDAAEAASARLLDGADLLSSAVLLTAGFDQSTRHAWRPSRNARRTPSRPC